MNQHQHSIDTTTGSCRESSESTAAMYGIEPNQLSAEVALYLGQVEYAKAVAVAEGCGSGELPARLNERVAEAEACLRMVGQRKPERRAARRGYLQGRRSALQFPLQDFLAAKRAEHSRAHLAARVHNHGASELPTIELHQEQPASQDHTNYSREFVDGLLFGLRQAVDEFQRAASASFSETPMPAAYRARIMPWPLTSPLSAAARISRTVLAKSAARNAPIPRSKSASAIHGTIKNASTQRVLDCIIDSM